MIRNPLSFRMQIFLVSLVIVLIPNSIFVVYISSQMASQANAQYLESQNALLNQANVSLNTLLADVQRIGNLHYVNDEVRRILMTNYADDAVKYAQDFSLMRALVTQAKLLNVNIVSTMYLNRYGYHFDYYSISYKNLQNMLARVEEWRDLARQADHYTYYGPIQSPEESGIYQKTILPILTVLHDTQSNLEIGVFYIGVDFNAIRDILLSSSIPSSELVFFNADNELFYAADAGFLTDEGKQELRGALAEMTAELGPDNPQLSKTAYIGGHELLINAAKNNTTSWSIVSVVDTAAITGTYWQNLENYFGVFLLNFFAGTLLAFFLSRSLARSIGDLCRQIDSCEDGNISAIQLSASYPNRELRKVMDSYNRLNQRLTDSLEQNYSIRLEEKQARLRMLQFQVNPHFFYNTLNLIGSLANIHSVPEIKTISDSMSEILRYNLRSGSTVTLEEELSQTQKYLAIQELRFPGRFRFQFDISPELLDVAVPPFIIQPLVENCIAHGLRNRERDALVSIYAYAENSELHLLISDNGEGIGGEKLIELQETLMESPRSGASEDDHASIGVLNVHQRIRTYYGEPYGIEIESAPGNGTIVTLRLPLP